MLQCAVLDRHVPLSCFLQPVRECQCQEDRPESHRYCMALSGVEEYSQSSDILSWHQRT